MPVDREALQARLRGLFVDELDDNVRVLERGLVALEQRDVGEPPGDVVHELFRAAHSLKGAASAAGVAHLEGVCHRLEDALARLRDRTLSIDERSLGPLFAAVGAIAAVGARMRAGAEPTRSDVADASLALAALLDTAGEPAPGPASPPPRPSSTAAEAPVPAAPAVPAPDARTRVGAETVRVPGDRLERLLDLAGDLLLVADRVDAVTGDLAATTRAVTGARCGDEEVWRSAIQQLERLSRSAAMASRLLTTATSALAAGVREARMLPLAYAHEDLERVVRDLSRAEGKPVRLTVSGGELEVDRPVLDVVRAALLHLVRNAIGHGIEPAADRARCGKPAEGRVEVVAALERGGVAVTVADDGRGVDLARLRGVAGRHGMAVPEDDTALVDLVFEPGVSTSPLVTDVSGRGVGLDAVRARAEEVGGSVRLDSTPGAGTSVALWLPLAVSALRVLLVGVGDEVVALPTSSVSSLRRVEPDAVRVVTGRPVVVLDQRSVPVLWLSQALGLGTGGATDADSLVGVVVSGASGHDAVLVVDALLSEQEVVMKPVGGGTTPVAGVLGATVLVSGRVALVVNPATCVRAGLERAGSPVMAAPAPGTPARRRVLLAEDSLTTRALERSILEAAGYDVSVAVDGAHAWQLLEDVGADVVVSDVDMPRMDGFALCRAVRRSSRFAALPFILVTSLSSDEDRTQGVEVGADAYIVKADFEQAVLLDAIERLL